MSDAQLKIATALVLVLVIIFGVLYLAGPKDEGTDEKAIAEVWKVDADHVAEVAINRASGRILLAKDGEKWKVEAPFEGPADGFTTKDLVNDLAGIKKGVPITGADRTTLGLGDPPLARVTLTMDDGSTKELYVGNEAVGHRTYVQTPGGGVVAVSESLSVLQKDAEEFRDRTVVHFEVQDVKAVVLQEPQGTLDLSSDDGGWWLKGFTRADPHKVEDMLSSLLDMRFDAFTTDAEPKITAPTHTMALTMADGSTVRVLFGDKAEKGTRVDLEGGLAGYVQPDSLAWIDQGPTDVADRSAFPVNVDSATKIGVKLGDVQWTLEKAGDAWQRDGKDEPNASAAIDAVSRARIEYQKDPVPPLATTWGTVVISTGDKERVIDIGQPEGDSWRVAKDEAGGGSYLVPTADLDAIARAFGAS